MRIGAGFKAPTVRVSSKPIATAPKIRQIRIQPVSNGIKLTHKMTEPHPDKTFVFHNPAKMVSHLKRLESNAWLKPMADPAPRTVGVLNIGQEP